MQIRTSLFYDEIWSYGLANSYDSSFLYENGYTNDRSNSFYNHWTDGRKFFEYITVQPQEGFAYNKVYDNQMADMHPPLYYFLLHTICSFFPDSFNRWYGQIICLIAFVFVQIALYMLAKLLFNEELMSLAMCAFFGFSMAAVNNFIYIRMYCLVTLWYLCITYIALKICKTDKITKYDGWLLFIFGFLGFMTHNHFAIYYFCLCISCGIYFVVRKKNGLLWRFAVIALFSFLAYYAVFPGLFKQAARLNMGNMCGGISGAFPVKALLANLIMIFNYTLATSVDKLFSYATSVVNLVGENISLLPVWLFLIISAIFEAIFLKKRDDKHGWIILALTVITYIVIISSYTILIRNSMYLGRYLFSVLPCFALLIFAIANKFIGLLKSIKWNKLLFIGVMLVIALATHYASVREWCYDTPPHREEMAERYRDASIIYASPIGMADALIHGRCQDFMYAKRVFVTRLKETEKIFTAIKECKADDKNYIILPITDLGRKIIEAIPLLIDKQPVCEFTDETNVCSFYVLSF